ncbi:hypothetical protein ZIOFF_048308 [Zingiber officinale]|uniref:Uncharacterized protein n=1 Tax=Zingiber officinale TaxID=94328 RepID=A0A8J5FZ07_ZINOF|nr:hypothetical protein ZIOFF_048308 [Zingiber officinale]
MVVAARGRTRPPRGRTTRPCGCMRPLQSSLALHETVARPCGCARHPWSGSASREAVSEASCNYCEALRLCEDSARQLGLTQGHKDHLQLSPYLSYFSGAFAGCAATIGSYPFDLLRTVLASQGEPKVYPTMRSALFDIIKTRGVRGLYAGLSPTLVEIIPYAALQFGSYDTFKRWMMAWNRYRFSYIGPIKPDDSLSSFQLILCGFAAGTCAKTICHPLDVVKKRFQIEGLERHPRYGARVESQKYKNMHYALRDIFHAEGWPGLYKGIFPSLLKSAPAAAVTFVAYEYTSNWLQSLLI